jgi:hypothetical protein
MKKIIVPLCILLALIITSCKKDEIVSPVNSVVMILSNVLIDNQSSYQYSYNDSSLVAEESSKLDFITHHYNDRNQVVASDYYWNSEILSNDIKTIEATLSVTALVTAANGIKAATINYEYDGNDQLTRATWSRTGSGSSEYSVFSYDDMNRIIRQTLYWNNQETGSIDYFYDSKGNLTKENLYDLSADGVAELSSTTKYEYDGKKNPYNSFRSLRIPGINTNINNIVKETYTALKTSDQETSNVRITVNSYEYNTNGYPVSRNGNIKYVYE